MNELVSDKQIIHFCRGTNPDKPRCDLFYFNSEGKPSCKADSARQGGRVFLEWCEVAVRNGVPGHLDDFTFYPDRTPGK